MTTTEEKLFHEIIALKRQGLLGEIIVEHTLEMLGNEVTPSRIEFTAAMLEELGKMFLKTSEKFKGAL